MKRKLIRTVAYTVTPLDLYACDEKIQCVYCECDLSARIDWEPMVIVRNGESVHARVCPDCLEQCATANDWSELYVEHAEVCIHACAR